MPITKLDENVALIVIDLQKGVVSMPTVHPTAEIVKRTAQLASAFRKRGLPVVLVNVTGMAPGRTGTPRPNFAFPPDWTDLAPELEQAPSDHLVSKQCWGAFLGTSLDEYLHKLGVTQVILVGVATSVGVESTARSAHDLGYHVVLVTDAITDLDAESHRHSIENIFPRLGETDTTENVLAMLKNA
jgi:nicotinamidase-related amidase